MIRDGVRIGFKVAAMALFTASLAIHANGNPDEGLQTIDNPGGGQIVYGPLAVQTSLSGAMGIVLREVHKHFGDRPQISKLFQARNSDSIATFFTLTAQGGKPIAGLVIVSLPSGAKPAAALIYDDKERFSKTVNPMLKTLNEAWHPASDKAAAQGASSVPPTSSTNQSKSPQATAPPAAPMPLHETAFPDNSGSVGLPEGWHITMAAGGMVHAAGPNGEQVNLGVIVQNNYDPNNPKVPGMLQYLTRAGIPFTVCPYGGDLVSAYRTISEQNHKRMHKPVPTLTVTSSQPMPPGPYCTAAALVLGELDNHDGAGPQTFSMRLSSMREGPGGGWALCVNGVSVPKQLADSEWPTMKAIVNSWRQNGAVIQQQTDRVIAEIHRVGDAATARSEAQHAANDAHNAAVYKQWDNQAKYSKSFQNYQFDRAEVQDNTTSTRGAVGYSYADALVKSDPNRYQYVNTQDFLKGVDY